MKPNKQLEDFIINYDFKGLQEAFAKGDVEWHEKEWKEFISSIRSQDIDDIVKWAEGRKKEECRHFGHTDGEQLDCDKNTIYNEGMSDLIDYIKSTKETI